MNKYLGSAYQFGGIGGILSVLAFVILSFLRSDPTNLNLIFGYVITPITLFLAIKFFKEYTNNGFLSFSEGMSVGFVTYCLIALISGLGIWLILILSPVLFEEIKLSKLEVFNQNKETIISEMGEDSFTTTLYSLQNMIPWDVAFSDAIWKVIPGLFFTIIISIILRKNPN
ncbi:MAG: DUF4199 domain-containing protein [Algoriphagus sp.]|nr:DUF4199 domain-containing protein [Algoriphagus sp.]